MFEETGARLDERMSRYSEWGLSGTVLVAHGQEIWLHKGYGLAERGGEVGPPVRYSKPSSKTVSSEQGP